MHRILRSRGRGSEKRPGEFRRSQNWIGGTPPGNAAFVPAPPEMVEDCMAALERFLHDESLPYPSLLRAALAHYQFETIHPFRDGNGRIGRLLIAFILHHKGVLKRPLLYLSLFFKRNRSAYYRLLDRMRTVGLGSLSRLSWKAWCRPLRMQWTQPDGWLLCSRKMRKRSRGWSGGELCPKGVPGFCRRPLLTLKIRSATSGADLPGSWEKHGSARAAWHRPRNHRQAAQPHLCLRPLSSNPRRGNGGGLMVYGLTSRGQNLARTPRVIASDI